MGKTDKHVGAPKLRKRYIEFRKKTQNYEFGASFR